MVKFHNYDKYPIDIKKYDQGWNEQLVKANVQPGYEYSEEAFFSHNYYFVRSKTHERLNSSANDVTAILFEGCRFQAETGKLIIVNVLKGHKFISCRKFYVGLSKIKG